MQPKCTQVEFTGQHVYVGLEIAIEAKRTVEG